MSLTATSLNRSPVRTIIVANNREYFSPLDSHVDATLLPEFVRSDLDESDMDVLWLGDNKLVLAPEGIDSDFLMDICGRVAFKNVGIAVPEYAGGGLCADIMQDSGTYELLVDYIRASATPQIVPWGTTPQYRALIKRLSQDGLRFTTPETSAEGNDWLGSYFDTKTGSRELVARVRDRLPYTVKQPEGFVCSGVGEAYSAASYFLGTGRGVALKANEGGAGLGVLVFDVAGRDSDPATELAKVRNAADLNPLFCHGPVIVEEYVRPLSRHEGRFPSVDGIIREDGRVEIQCVDAMVIHSHDNAVGFYGCLLGKGLYSEAQRRVLYETGKVIGDELSSLGYRGWYDVDFVLSPSGDLYITECNLRRTSICYMLDLGKRLIGDHFDTTVAMRSNDKFISPALEPASYLELRTCLSPISFPISGERRGVVITQSFRTMLGRGKFGYVVIGNDQDDTYALELHLSKLLRDAWPSDL